MTLALENLSSCRKVLKLSQERLTIKVFRPLRRTAKDAVFGNCHLLKKVGENFMIALPRERQAASLHLTDNANSVQAQPACRKVLKLSQERLTIKAFRPLRRTAKDVAFENHHLLEKVDENFKVLKRERPEGSRPARER